VVCDKFVRVPLVVTDYHTERTGITKLRLASPYTISLYQARAEVGKLIKGKILIGHGLEVDLAALGLSHPWCDVRDTTTYPPFMEEVSDSSSASMLLPRDLSALAQIILGCDVVGCSIKEEAAACLDLYKAVRSDWEAGLVNLVQQKEKQRQLVMSMRAGSRVINKKSHMSAPLSAIREDETARPVSTIEYVNDPQLPLLPRDDGKPHRDSNSTLSSTEPTTAFNTLSYRDEYSSRSSSFMSQDTDRASSISSLSRFDSGRFSEIENLQEGMAQTSLRENALPSISTSMHMRSIHGDAWYLRTAHTATNSHPSNSQMQIPAGSSDVWCPPPSPTVGRAQPMGNGAGWSQSGMSSLHHNVESVPSQQETIVTSLTDEELLRHLPSGLIADLDEGSDNIGRKQSTSPVISAKDVTSHPSCTNAIDEWDWQPEQRQSRFRPFRR
jgi:hypothetical protein